MKFSLIVAVDKNNGIGKNNALPWKLKADMKFFTKTTTETSDKNNPLPLKQNAVIMGRNTWESLPPNHRPLKGRLNIVLTREAGPVESNDAEGGFIQGNLVWKNSLDAALKTCEENTNIEKVFVIGGARLFAEAIKHPLCQTIYLTQLEQTFKCDTFFPQVDEKIFAIKERSGVNHENGIDFEFLTYERRTEGP
jgi:dihydrofolate reductase